MSKEYLLPPNSPTSKSRTKPKKNISDLSRCTTIPARRAYPIASNDHTDNIEEREIRQLLDTVPVVPKLPKMPDISKYLNKGKTLNKSKAISDRKTIIKNYM